jgi:LmbE family N-acetylglucosaminyl deacetylase
MSDRPNWDEYDVYMLVVAHPDDAEFASGGTMSRLVKLGKTVVIVQVTSGDKGTTDASISPEELAKSREVEELEAAKAIGVQHVEFLRAADGELTPDLILREKIVRMIRTYRPDVLITHDPFRPYAFHPDHRAVGFAAHDAVYPTARDPHYFPEHLRAGLEPHKTAEIWYFNAEEPDLVIDISDTFDDKCNALRGHVSQIGDGADVFPRVRERNAELAEGHDFELAEAFKAVQMRR